MSSDSQTTLTITDTVPRKSSCNNINDKTSIKNNNNDAINKNNNATEEDVKVDEFDSSIDNNNNNNVETIIEVNGASGDVNTPTQGDTIKSDRVETVAAKNCVEQKIVLSSELDKEKTSRQQQKTRSCCRFRGGTLSMLHLLLAVTICHLVAVERVSGGICWASIQRNGRCKELTGENLSKEECCSSSQGPATAWSFEDLDTGTLFFWRVLGGGVPCNTCKESCDGVQCSPGRRCVMRKGRPRCVCAPRCGGGRGGPVCGTDGRTYSSLCRLRKRACRRRDRDLALDYHGHCQDSCSKIRCGVGRHCLMDQDLRTHCVKCSRVCPRARHSDHERAVCGADGVTYPSTCHLQAAACKRGRSIPLAYKGPCDPKATCETVKCRARQVCLVEWQGSSPRCVTCHARCPRARGSLCASNNKTYPSFCQMLRDACIMGYVLESKHKGTCTTEDMNDFNLVSNEDEDE